jgi:hypothetical protein
MATHSATTGAAQGLRLRRCRGWLCGGGSRPVFLYEQNVINIYNIYNIYAISGSEGQDGEAAKGATQR